MTPGPPARAVDWAILTVVLLQALTGVSSILVGRPEGSWVVASHGIGGLALVVLIGLKLWRVRRRLRPRRLRREMWSSVLAGVLVLAVLGTGIAWASGWRPWVAAWTLLTLHAVLGLLLAVPVAIHLRTRIHRPRRVDFADRRTAIQFGLLAGGGTLAWSLQRQVARVVSAPARFTGSYETDSFAGNAFPSTSWVADDPEPIDPETWSLQVDGAVERSLALGPAVLDGAGEGPAVPTDAEAEAILDCTSGWYSAQRWRGIAVGELLDAAGARPDARWVSFHSVTGYRWSLPIDEARRALLATHVTGERLSHAHGFPLRLVAPGRRGFQWVKWVERVEVRERPDYGQWIAIFTSGFE